MTKKIFFIVSVLLSFSLTLLQCGTAETTQKATEPNTEEPHKGKQIIKMTPQEMDEFDVQTAVAEAGILRLHVSLPGEVVIPPDNLAHIHPRFPGIVKEVRKTVGDRVRKGEILAIIESNESMSDYALKSLIDGTVIEMHMTRGEMVDDGEHGFVVADLRDVWIYLQVYQKDLPHVHVGQKVVISAGRDLPQVRGQISYISPVIDKVTRTAEARVVLRNKKGVWKPGLFVTGRIVTQKVAVNTVVPKTALEILDGQTVIFVQQNNGFWPRPVVTGRENDDFVEIKHGLQAGETYVSKNGFILKAELLKSEFGEEHAH